MGTLSLTENIVTWTIEVHFIVVIRMTMRISHLLGLMSVCRAASPTTMRAVELSTHHHRAPRDKQRPNTQHSRSQMSIVQSITRA